ncbi:MAG TPA: helix-turn-helix domain-containing protein [Mycobacteriales bacterium]|nr:helix-turn-helix domain-containing protein [Mycobacteriales bacterium]
MQEARDPLIEHLIRSTVPSAVSALPQRAGGTRSRAGNAMARTRGGLLDGALRAVAKHGTRRTTMHDIAMLAGVAKATLYNHFRTKDDVWSALVEAEVQSIAAECADQTLVDALTHAALRLSGHQALRHVAESEPAALAGLLVRRPQAAGWRAAEAAVGERLTAAGRSGADLVLRWLSSYLATPAQPDAVRAAAEALVRGLPVNPQSQPPAEPARSISSADGETRPEVPR